LLPGERASPRPGHAQAIELRLAVSNLESIAHYIAAFNPRASQRLAQRLIDVAESLAEFPDRGRDAGEGRREISIVWPYILRYRVEEDRILILRIRHGAREQED
jgi:toxin ParE1/3/4